VTERSQALRDVVFPQRAVFGVALIRPTFGWLLSSSRMVSAEVFETATMLLSCRPRVSPSAIKFALVRSASTIRTLMLPLFGCNNSIIRYPNEWGLRSRADKKSSHEPSNVKTICHGSCLSIIACFRRTGRVSRLAIGWFYLAFDI
jgi:hypothetical protein